MKGASDALVAAMLGEILAYSGAKQERPPIKLRGQPVRESRTFGVGKPARRKKGQR